MKALSQLLEELEPEPVNGFSGYVDIEDYTRMKRVAIELAMACEEYAKAEICVPGFIDKKNQMQAVDWISVWDQGKRAVKAIDRAKDIIGEGE